ncbi:MAG TPA: bifunctional nuclease family protein, partial [Dehalococcoidia bacterium]|nr:bifunctional nuclease family protein [Dehalococcoidia bacterium]
ERCPGPVFDDPSLRGIGRFLSLADSVSLIIERFDEDVFYTKFLIAWRGESYQIDCPCAWALALGVRAGARIFAEETVLHQTGISVAT